MPKSSEFTPDPAAAKDPFVYASLLTTLWGGHNPIETLVGDVARMFHVVTHLNGNLKAARSRVSELEGKIAMVEATMATVNPKTAGHRLDKTR